MRGLAIVFALCLVPVLSATPAAAESKDAATTGQLAEQSRARIVVHPRKIEPGPNAKRRCVSWLAEENRPSGPVVTPQMHCWWQ
jgi:hypothetical protein